MDDELAAIAHINGGYLMRGQLNDLGVSDAAIRAMRRDGVLRRIRHGTYVVNATWSHLSDSEKHCVVVRSVLDKLGDAVVATHQSACALHGLDLWGLDLTAVHVTRVDSWHGRREAGVVYHQGVIDGGTDVEDIDGRRAVEPVRAAIETAARTSTESGMVVVTSMMRHTGVSKDEVNDRTASLRHWPGMRRADLAIRLSDARLESVGEVRSMHMFWQWGIPAPEPQHVVVDEHGVFVARSDYYWRAYRHTGEFDGLIKYGRLNPYADDAGRVLTDEKLREDAVRSLDLGVSRWVWAELSTASRPHTSARIRSEMERSRRLYTRNATVIA